MYNIQTFYGWQTQYKCVMSTHKYFTNTHKCVHIHKRNTQQTFREIHTLNHEMRGEHSANYLRSSTKYTTNTPLNAGNRFIVPVYFCCHFIYCSKTNRRNQKQATLKITNKEKELSLHTVCRKDTL